MLLRGRFDMAFLLGGAAAWLFGWSGFSFPGLRSRTAKTAGSVSRVRSAMIEMELDHDTGDMNGTVLAGPNAGRALNDLAEDALRALYAECRQADPDGARLLEAYLDRRFPRWREDAQARRGCGAGRAAALRSDDGRGSLPDPGPSAGGEPRRGAPGASDPDEETSSRPGGIDVSRGQGESGQRGSLDATSLILHARSGPPTATASKTRRRGIFSCGSRSRRSRCA